MYCKTVKERIQKAFGTTEEEAIKIAEKMEEIYHKKSELSNSYGTMMTYIEFVTMHYDVEPEFEYISNPRVISKEVKQARYEKQVAKLKAKYGIEE